jgi:hypothetical protein
MRFKTRWLVLHAALCLAALPGALAQSAAAPVLHPVLVELFTSEGCSSCPPADQLLQQINGKRTDAGQLIIGLSEHVTYWNHDGWSDRFSQDVFTQRQTIYGSRFHLADIYTPQMVVNGREQVSGGNAAAVLGAIRSEDRAAPMRVEIGSVAREGKKVQLTFSVSGEVPARGVDIYAVFADDAATTKVISGENGGRTLTHAAVARTLTRVATVKAAGARTVAISEPSKLSEGGHHLVVFAQQAGQGEVLSADSKPL